MSFRRTLMIALVLTFACSAAKADVVAYLAATGPVALLDDGTVLAQQGTAEIDSIAPDGTVRRLVPGVRTDGSGVSGTNGTLSFAASAQQLVYEDSYDGHYRDDNCIYGECGWELSSGPLGGPFQTLASCSGPPSEDSDGPPYAVSGDLLAFVETSCDPSIPYDLVPPPETVLVRNASGAAPDVPITLPSGEDASILALSGNVLAAVLFPFPQPGADVGERETVMTWDATTGAPLSDTTVPVGVDGIDRLALEPSGNFAIGGRTGSCNALSAAAPNLQAIPGCADPFAPVVLDQDRLTFVADDTLQTTNLSGSRIGTGIALGDVPLGGFDTDGTDLLLSLPTCDGHAEIERTALLAPTPSQLQAACPVQVLAAHAGSSGRLTLRLRCPRGCHLRISASTRSGRRLAGKAVTIGPPMPQLVTLLLRRAAGAPTGQVIVTVSSRDLTGGLVRQRRTIRRARPARPPCQRRPGRRRRGSRSRDCPRGPR